MLFDLKIGNKVIIKPLNWIKKYYYNITPNYNNRLFGFYYDKNLLPFYNRMKLYCGKQVTISYIFSNKYKDITFLRFKIEEDNGKDIWDEMMIETSDQYIDDYLIKFCNNRCVKDNCSTCPLNCKVGEEFYVGEKVLVKSKKFLFMFRNIEFYDYGNTITKKILDSINKNNFCLPNSSMNAFCNKIVTISSIDNNKYKIEEDNGKNTWSSLMFDKINLKIRQELFTNCNTICSYCDKTCPLYSLVNLFYLNTEST